MQEETMKQAIKDLIAVSHYYGRNKNYIIAGGGNTSYKNKEYMWVKASGVSLADITETGFAVLKRAALAAMSVKKYSSEPAAREAAVKQDLLQSSLHPENNIRPSVEASLHALLDYHYVVHTHPALINAFTCSKHAPKQYRQVFGKDVLFIKYTDPGYILYKEAEKQLSVYRRQHKKDPQIILLQNHGIFVAADTIASVKRIYQRCMKAVQQKIKNSLQVKKTAVAAKASGVLPAVRMLLTDDKGRICRVRYNTLIKHFAAGRKNFAAVSRPFTPDNIVYCRANPLYVNCSGTAAAIVSAFKKGLAEYRRSYGYDPRIVIIPEIGIIAVEENYKNADTLLDIMEDVMKIAYYSRNFGGPRPMSAAAVDFIKNWEAENYRRQVAAGRSSSRLAADKIVVITGGARGFGAGLAEQFVRKGANVVIADLDSRAGRRKAAELNRQTAKNCVLFVKTDVARKKSVKHLLEQTVLELGGLDVFISNAGILKAGSLEQMNDSVFRLMTEVNYSAYFLCAKYAAAVLKQQHACKNDYFTDIIQINSKSGLKGSNKNFAYAGSKFGGLGLTQSFALELMPYKIKVNSVCPGNFFNGPLWSDPEKGLFVQYLRAGKVPGAKTINDIKNHYAKQVPAGRGCEVTDVMKAVLYIMDQTYETGQAVPVTGGQNMLK